MRLSTFITILIILIIFIQFSTLAVSQCMDFLYFLVWNRLEACTVFPRNLDGLFLLLVVFKKVVVFLGIWEANLPWHLTKIEIWYGLACGQISVTGFSASLILVQILQYGTSIHEQICDIIMTWTTASSSLFRHHCSSGHFSTNY